MTFLTKNLDFRTNNSSFTPLFTQFVVCLTSNNSTSQNIGGRMHGPTPHLKFGGVPPLHPLSLRPWIDVFAVFIYAYVLIIGPTLRHTLPLVNYVFWQQ